MSETKSETQTAVAKEPYTFPNLQLGVSKAVAAKKENPYLKKIEPKKKAVAKEKTESVKKAEPVKNLSHMDDDSDDLPDLDAKPLEEIDDESDDDICKVDNEQLKNDKPKTEEKKSEQTTTNPTELKIQELLHLIGKLTRETADTESQIKNVGKQHNINVSPQCTSLNMILDRIYNDLASINSTAAKLRETLKHKHTLMSNDQVEGAENTA